MVAEVLACLRCPISDAEAAHSEVLALKAAEPLRQDALLLDGTLGTGGHTIAMLRSRQDVKVVAFDRDAVSIEVARARLRQEKLEDRVAIVRGDFRHAPRLLESHLEKQADASIHAPEAPSRIASTWVRDGGAMSPKVRVDGALVDAGMSMWQVADASHGLSFRLDAPLDMRYDRSQEWSAFDLVNRLAPIELEDVLFHYTDESWARRIVEFIVEARRKNAIESTSELASIVEAAIPVGARRGSKVHAATKTFAALRLAVNTEYWALDEGVRALCSVLDTHARLVILTYSSHEDRIVKRLFRRLQSRPDVIEGPPFPQRAARDKRGRRAVPVGRRNERDDLPRGLGALEPEIVELLKLPDEAMREDEAERALKESGWGRDWIGVPIPKKPLEPSRAEVESNPLSRSCKLRAIEKRPLEA